MSVIVLPMPGNEAMAQRIARAGDFELGQIGVWGGKGAKDRFVPLPDQARIASIMEV